MTGKTSLLKRSGELLVIDVIVVEEAKQDRQIIVSIWIVR
jgi:hypothetical protein